jgi:hypothetical protein
MLISMKAWEDYKIVVQDVSGRDGQASSVTIVAPDTEVPLMRLSFKSEGRVSIKVNIDGAKLIDEGDGEYVLVHE